MQQVKEKLTFGVNFLKFFGSIPESFKEPRNKRLKFLKYWPFGMIIAYTVYFTIITLKMIKMFIIDGDFNIRTDYVGIFLIITLHLRGFIDIVYTILLRKTEDKIWNLLDQLDDFMVRFLGIDMKYQKENWLHLIEIATIFIVCMTLGRTMGIVNYSLTEKFNSHYGIATFITTINLVNVIKYVFYVSILHCRLNQLTKSLDEVKLHDYKLRTLPHVYSIIWKLSKILEKRFTIPLIITIFYFFMAIIFFGYVVAQSVLLNIFSELYIASSIMPQVTIWILSFYCHRISKIVSKI